MKINKIKMIKKIIILLVVQFCIIWTFYINYDYSKPVTNEDLQYVSGIADDVLFYDGSRYSATYLDIKIDSVSYKWFLDSASIKRNSELKNAVNSIKEGDIIRLKYKPVIFDKLIYGNAIIELEANEVIYQTIDDFNDFHKGVDTFWVVVLILAESITVFSVLVDLFVYLWGSNGKIGKFIDKVIFNKKPYKKKSNTPGARDF